MINSGPGPGRRAPHIPGIEPRSDEGRLVYDAIQLAGRPDVVAALATAPTEFVEPGGDPAFALTREELLRQVTLATDDGRTWGIVMGDQVAHGPAHAASDWLDDDDDAGGGILGPTTAVLAAALEAEWAEELDREVIELTLAAPRPADQVLASFLHAVVTEYRYALWSRGFVDGDHTEELGRAAAERVRAARASATVQAIADAN